VLTDFCVEGVQKQVILCWFVTFGSFRQQRPELLTGIFFSRVDRKQQQNDQKLCTKDLGEKCSYLGLVSIFGRFSYLGSSSFVLSVF